MSEPASSLVCGGCGEHAPARSLPFRCPATRPHDNIDHVLRRVLDPTRVALPRRGDANPFVRYRELLHSYHVAIDRGLAVSDFAAMVESLNDAVARVDGRGFTVTPFAAADALGERLGFAAGRLWVKDETGNVSGSHKGRHLFGLAIGLGLEAWGVGRAAGGVGRLAVASCGNAALAAAAVARAADRELEVFIPLWADPHVVARLEGLGARLTVCAREPGVTGDPCYRRFHEAVAVGAIPFCCQGPDHGLTIEGGSTLAWEMVDGLGERTLDRIFVQVGGGALASACALGFADALKLGRITRLPRLHAVQTEGGFPLKRAYDRVLARIAQRMAVKTSGTDFSPTDYPALADLVRAHADAAVIREELHYAATHRSEFMWPWETPPRSVATGILDDETYDWLAVVEAMLTSGGYPVVVSEETLKAANALAVETTAVPVDHTGTAGLAGLMQTIETEARLRDETVAVIFSGVRRTIDVRRP